MSALELALQRSKYKHLSDEEWRWFLQQVEGRERTADKLPTFASIADWWYPVRLSCEQCSSELTATYKASLMTNGQKLMADLTGGYGVDTYFLSERFEHTDYVEQNAELCRIAEHNFANKSIDIHNSTAEEFLASAGQYDLIFLDPARRDSHGGKVFRLEDCTPNVVELLPTLLSHSKRLMLKLSPMLDISQAVNTLSAVNWDIHIVAIKNEVKEVSKFADFIKSVTEKLNIEKTQASQLRLAVEEAVVNVIDYAYPAGKEGEIEIRMMSDGQTLKTVIIDSGVAFDPTAMKKVDTSLSAEDRQIGDYVS